MEIVATSPQITGHHRGGPDFYPASAGSAIVPSYLLPPHSSPAERQGNGTGGGLAARAMELIYICLSCTSNALSYLVSLVVSASCHYIFHVFTLTVILILPALEIHPSIPFLPRKSLRALHSPFLELLP